MGLPRKCYRLQILILGSSIGLGMAFFFISLTEIGRGLSVSVTPSASANISATTSQRVGPRFGQQAPDFELPTLTEDTVRLADFRGRPVLINFWATWCGPCREEMPALIEAYATWQGDGLTILAVNMTALDSLEDVRAFADEFNVPFPILLDRENRVTDELYQVMGVPMSFFIARDGRVTDRHIGAMNREQIAAYIQKIL